MSELERLARALDAAEDAVIAASGQHREDLWDAAREAQRKFHDAADPEMMLSLLDVCKAAQAVVERWDTPLWKDVPHTGEYIHALRAALAATRNRDEARSKP